MIQAVKMQNMNNTNQRGNSSKPSFGMTNINIESIGKGGKIANDIKTAVMKNLDGFDSVKQLGGSDYKNQLNLTIMEDKNQLVVDFASDTNHPSKSWLYKTEMFTDRDGNIAERVKGILNQAFDSIVSKFNEQP